jgi:hypothetical protein
VREKAKEALNERASERVRMRVRERERERERERCFVIEKRGEFFHFLVFMALCAFSKEVFNG